MARGHPTDEMGRVLPACTWPADKAAPDGLDVLRRFCNTCNHESGADRFHTVDGLRRWLRDEPLMQPVGTAAARANDDDRRRLVDVREHLRRHALAHHDGVDAAGFAVPLDRAVLEAPVALHVHDGRLTLRPVGDDVAGRVVGVLAMAVMEAQRTDRWGRFKACPSCGWVFYDRSKNQAGRWCSMRACGGRAKVAAYRRRRREETP
jgi:predicted RNA-binding Zn ribbon-like protein